MTKANFISTHRYSLPEPASAGVRVFAFALFRLLAALTLVALADPVRAAARSSRVPLIVQLDWVANAQFAGLIVAKERGLYAAAGLDVTLRPIDPVEMDAVAPVLRAKDEAWIGCADGTFLLKARAKGAPVRAFATMLQASPIGVVTLAEHGVADLSELVGKKIGLHAYNRSQLAIMLGSAGLTLDQVIVVEIGDEIDSLLSGKIDAQVCYLIDEPVAMERRGAKLRMFPGFQHGYAGYAQVYFAPEHLLARDPALLSRFLSASNEGWRQALAEPDATAALVVKKYLAGGDVVYQAESLRKLAQPLFAETGLTGIGQMRRTTWERSARAAQVVPETEVAALLDGFLDFSVLRAVYPSWTPPAP